MRDFMSGAAQPFREVVRNAALGLGGVVRGVQPGFGEKVKVTGVHAFIMA